MSWSFAIVNNRLAEIYFDKKKNGPAKIRAHYYVKKADYRTKQEQKWIHEDMKQVRVVYRKGRYKLVSPR